MFDSQSKCARRIRCRKKTSNRAMQQRAMPRSDRRPLDRNFDNGEQRRRLR